MSSSTSTTLNLAGNVFLHAQMQPGHTARSSATIRTRISSSPALPAASRRGCATAARATRRAPINGNHAAAGPRVGILAARSIETYAGIVGTAWAGGTYVPLNPKTPAARLSYVIERGRLDALIVDVRGVERLAELGRARRETYCSRRTGRS